jgi:aspartate/methionine/tyrosine aminotransferase
VSIPRFEIERYFAQHEFSARHLLGCSDCEPVPMDELVGMADGEARDLWDSLRLGYTESAGHPLLRAAIADSYPTIDPSGVLVAAPEECIYLTMTSLLEPGDRVVCTFPGYQSLYEIARSIGCEVSLWMPDEQAGWRFRIEDLAELLCDETRLVVANFPHNPTGALPSVAEFEAMVDLVRGAGAALLSDEMYRGLEIDDADLLPAACDLYERAITLSGLSKAYGLAGLRLGWLATHDADALGRIAEAKDYTTICSSAPSEILALIALRNRDVLIGRQRARVARNLGHVDRLFDERAELVRWNRPRAGSVGFPRVDCTDDTDRLCCDLIEEAGILLVPSSVFAYGTKHVRIGFGREDLPEAIERFDAWLGDRFG